jgi:general secretion pathway protein I
MARTVSAPYAPPETRATRRIQGFTLVEVLVALAIVAIALTAGLRATSALTLSAQRQQEAFLGQLCAENILIRYRLLGQLPGPGSFEETCTQAERNFLSQVRIQPTPNPNFRRLEVRMLLEGRSILQVSAIVGSN